MAALNPYAACGVAVREFGLQHGPGTADYMLYVDGRAAGVVEAKREGYTLTGVEAQSENYGAGLPSNLPFYVRPLPFLYESTGAETRFTNGLGPSSAEPERLLVPYSWYAGRVVGCAGSICPSDA